MEEYIAEVRTAIEQFEHGFLTAYELVTIIQQAERPSLEELRQQHNAIHEGQPA